MACQILKQQWLCKLENLEALRKPEEPNMEILRLSYDFLHPNIKPCFLYLSFFSRNEIMSFDYILELWGAEGLIPEGDNGRELGLLYLGQLCDLCLIERGQVQLSGKFCTLHNLFYDLIVSISKEIKCGFTLQEGCSKCYFSCCSRNLSRIDKANGCCRIFLANQEITDNDLSDKLLFFPKFLSTFSLRENDKIKNIPGTLFNKVRALCVLDLSNTGISTLPNNIRCLKLLRVLNVKGTNILVIPECIRNIKNLRMFIHGNKISKIVPNWIGELKFLEHLDVSTMSMPKTVLELPSLQVLKLHNVFLEPGDIGLLRMKDFGNMRGLRVLGITVSTKAELDSIRKGDLKPLVKMRQFIITNGGVRLKIGNFPLLLSQLKSMINLELLGIAKFNVSTSNWIRKLENLAVLTLMSCDCTDYPALESLPNLSALHLLGNKKCSKVRESFGKTGSFLKLRCLEICDFPMLEEFPVLEGGSFPLLEDFIFNSSKRVRRVDGLDQLKSLKSFDFKGSGSKECRENFERRGERVEEN